LRAGIPDLDLPKTFRDAVQVTRELGVRYLWIDSLCIIQDSREDWESESIQMGAIYEGAFVRIAASGARDSSEGCFMEYHRHQSGDTINNIITTSLGEDKGTIRLRMPDVHARDLVSQPLTNRGWAFQESCLARRTIHFFHQGLVWECKDEYFNQRNCQSYELRDLGIDWSSWENVVHKYSRCKLTLESDRLMAIVGLANALAKTRADQYCMGLWIEDLPAQLLWQVWEIPDTMEGMPDIPSWSWVSRKGQKFYCYADFPRAPAQNQVGTQFIGISEDHTTMSLKGSAIRCICSATTIDNEDIKYFASNPESMMAHPFHNRSRFLYSNSTPSSHPIGLVELDPEEIYEDLYFSVMLVGERLNGDWLLPESETGAGYKKDVPLKLALKKPRTDPESLSTLALMQQHGKHSLYYWVLMMRRVSEKVDAFQRVEIGIVWPSEWDKAVPSGKTFHLV
ncbi:heterokaryon incompatibility protein-domain-containing protein, partial [Dendryphion nanum]